MPAYTPEEMQTETRPLHIGGAELYASVVHIYKTFTDNPSEAQVKLDAAYHDLATELEQASHSSEQKTACLITNIEPSRSQLTDDMIDDWFKNASENNAATQQYLFSIFKRPVLQIAILSGYDSEELNQRSRAVNTSANTQLFVDSFDEAINIAKKQLRVAHRL